mmetsp:Transcript_44142/g.116840  ORF Transcript_44142/g.116840 Transcript_44142/m.116840 type:complete len:83 (+) Transcript_44142:4386-4634(+)
MRTWRNVLGRWWKPRTTDKTGRAMDDGWLFASVVVACLPTGFSLVLDPRERALQGARVLTSDDDEPRSDEALLLRFSVDHAQ